MLSTIALDTQVLRPGLCTGCGACQGLCPYWGSVDGRTVCFFDCERADGRCQRFCPRMPTDLDALRKHFFPEDTILPEIGPFLGLYPAGRLLVPSAAVGFLCSALPGYRTCLRRKGDPKLRK